MEQNIEPILVEFNNKANQLFVKLSHEFATSVKRLDRKKDEHLYRAKSEQYVVYLRQQLNETARTLLDKHRSTRGIEQLSPNLTRLSEQYLHQFVQKIRSL